MGKFEEIEVKVGELEAALTAEQAQVAALLGQKDAAILSLEATVADLISQQADGGTAESRQAVIDRITTTITNLKTMAPPTE